MEDDEDDWDGGNSDSDLEKTRTTSLAGLKKIFKIKLVVNAKEDEDSCLTEKDANNNEKYNIDALKLPNPTKRLLYTQIEYFPRIIKELNANGRKMSHWAWYVWPTTMPGRSDCRSTAVTDKSAGSLLKLTKIESWSKILNLLTECIELKIEDQKRAHIKSSSNNNAKRKTVNAVSYVIPPIDHGRIEYFFEYWLTHVVEITKEYPEFYSSILKFKQCFSKK